MDILTETQNLWQRYQQGAGFRKYVKERLPLVVPALAVFLVYSLAVTAGSVITLGGTRSILVLVGLLTAPLVLLGTLFVQVFVFFSWLEERALHPHWTQTLQQSLSGLRKVLAAFSPVMHGAGAAILLLPLLLLAAISLWIALLMLALVVGTLVAYAALDR
jgi:hypothetical protein